MVTHTPSWSSKPGARVAFAIALAILGLIATPGRATAQFGTLIVPPDELPVLEPLTIYPPTVATSAAGPYLPVPSWDQTLAPSLRFVILTNFSNEAVLDRESGLVWSRRFAQLSGSRNLPWTYAEAACDRLTVGNRQGWRLPTRAELATLIDPSRVLTSGVARLPEGHPFVVDGSTVWTSEASMTSTSDEKVIFQLNLQFGSTLSAVLNPFTHASALCVRGRP